MGGRSWSPDRVKNNGWSLNSLLRWVNGQLQGVCLGSRPSEEAFAQDGRVQADGRVQFCIPAPPASPSKYQNWVWRRPDFNLTRLSNELLTPWLPLRRTRSNLKPALCHETLLCSDLVQHHSWVPVLYDWPTGFWWTSQVECCPSGANNECTHLRFSLSATCSGKPMTLISLSSSPTHP